MCTTVSTVVAFVLPIIMLVLAPCTKAEIIAVNSMNRTDVFLDVQLRLIKEIEGVIVEAEPENACSSISGPPADLPASLNCFVLIKNDPKECFSDKQIKHAMEAGYSAAVIYNSISKIFPDIAPSFYSIGSENITSVLISESSANIIKTYYLYNNDSGSRLFIHENRQLLSLVIGLGITAGVVSIFALLFVLVKCLARYWHREHSRLSLRRINQLRTIKYTRGGPYETCAICLDEYKEKDTLRVLPCSHAYHRKCIDPWLISGSSTCPMCKRGITARKAQYDNEPSSHNEEIAETAPLLQMPPGNSQRGFGHGTFVNVPGAGTSRHAPSGALGRKYSGKADQSRLCSSAPTILMITSDSPDGHISSNGEQLPSHAIDTASEESLDELSPSSSLDEEKSRLIV